MEGNEDYWFVYFRAVSASAPRAILVSVSAVMVHRTSTPEPAWLGLGTDFSTLNDLGTGYSPRTYIVWIGTHRSGYRHNT
jgi:hypothetical protein